MRYSLHIVSFIIFTNFLCAQESTPNHQNEIFWEINSPGTISWNLSDEKRLPHADNIEMSGQKVAGIIYYSINEQKELSLRRQIIFPQLRTFIGSNESPWKKYRAYLTYDYEDNILPTIIAKAKILKPGPLDSVSISGMLHFYHAAVEGIKVHRILFPSMTERLFVEQWSLSNTTDSTISLKIGNTSFYQEEEGVYGLYKRTVTSDAEKIIDLKPGKDYSFSIRFTASLNDEEIIQISSTESLTTRKAFLDSIQQNLILETPDPILNTLFYFSKIRAAESIFKTKMGLVHSPGGGRYYCGVWANDQAEYSGPFFPYLGLKTGNIAALNAYRVFLNNIPEEDGHFWSSFEMNGDLTCCGGDRGDAAMIAYGSTHYIMASGSKEIAEELWPLIKWCLDYCERQKNEYGVIKSDTDEMEGRIPTGDANLSTSSLYYGALLHAVDLAKEIYPETDISEDYRKRAFILKVAIENYFGTNIDGIETYQYFEGHEFLRHWICLPLVMGIEKRREGTLEALFSKLWTNNGVKVEVNPGLEEPDLFWDRGTLYAFIGAFKAGASNQAYQKLHAYSQTRLLGFHVPYVVEAWPEGNMAHLSAESALYCRIFTEGLLGINPKGFNNFELTPQLPTGWDFFNLKNIHAFGKTFTISLKRKNDILNLIVRDEKNIYFDDSVKPGSAIKIKLIDQ
ncbi:MAG: six-hairpin glycosidase-like protein [Bacteroidales bacterium]|nr:six-hairpin glycosidase-like protein [Bacteroidales bacterium]MCF8403514.1 six-hairpin glycosidase-like protein [Bacteroidales bacterium]